MPLFTIRKKYLQASIQSDYNLEKYESAYTLIEEFSAKWPGDSHEKRFTGLKENMQHLAEQKGRSFAVPKDVNMQSGAEARSDSLRHNPGDH